jgi:hypothetical protein
MPLPSAEEVFAMRDEERRKLRLDPRKNRKKGKAHRYAYRPDFPRDELVKYMRNQGDLSRRKFDEAGGPEDPKSYDYRKEFGSWSRAKEFVFGSPAFAVDKTSARYLCACVCQKRLWTIRAFREAHRMEPDIVPSVKHVYRRYGRWSNLLEQAKRMSPIEVVAHYLHLRRRLGRRPTVPECENEGIAIRLLLKVHKSMSDVDEYALSVERELSERRM